MADLSKYSSLERFTVSRGRQLVGPSANLKGLNVQFGIGIGLIVIATCLWIAAVLSGVNGLAIGAIGPMIAGTVNAVVAWALKKRFAQSPIPVTNLTPESRAMLTSLTWTYIWSKNPWVWGVCMPQIESEQTNQVHFVGGAYARHPAWRQTLNQRGLSSLPEEVLDQMEAAAYHFNRTAGALEAGSTAGSLTRLRPKILQAADEAMLDVLHQAQLVSQFPEGIKAIRGRLTGSVETLKELGDRVEALTLREPTFTEMIAGRTMADEVLEELRLEQSAFNELSSQEDDSPRDHLQA